ncbi:cell division protein FtsA [Candidatus Chlorohelix sp.]|uniref:cell division protein FtsA n=1 Tax=Candidatus Chlorohelix sp. TaxID=3139201 RepID=UPI00306053C2
MAVNREKPLVGIDIGTSKISCIIGQVTKDGHIDITGYGVSPSKGLAKGVVVNIEETSQSIASSVEKAERLAGIKVGSANVGVTGSHISSINSRGVVAVSKLNREIGHEDVARVMDSARAVAIPPQREVLHVIPRTYVIDGQDGVRDPIGMSGYRLEVETHIVTGAVSILNNLYKAVQRVGIEVEELVLESLAASEAVLGEAEKRLGVVLVDIGSGTTDIAIYIDGTIWHTAVLPIGGNHITNDIAIVLRTPLETAERLKTKYGDASVIGSMKGYYGGYYGHDNWKLRKVDENPKIEEQPDEMIEVEAFEIGSKQRVSRKTLNEVIYARARQLFEMVQGEIKKSGYDAMIPAGIVLTGGSASLAGITDAAAHILRMPVRVGVPRGMSGMGGDALNNPTYSAGVGLVLWGLKKMNGEAILQEPRRASSGGGGVGRKFSGWLRNFLPSQ